MASLDRRISQLEQLNEESTDHSLASQSFAAALREARMRFMRGETLPETPITRKMLDDPVEGEIWRNIRDARARARKPGG
jgi:hypothetical protein